MKKNRKQLREGFTTGSSAAAAAAACIEALTGNPPVSVTIDLPIGGNLTIPVHSFEKRNGHLIATIRKDAGDDPDVTDKAIIGARVTPKMWGAEGHRIILKGGRGIGKVTRPGLPVAVGEDAINPVPKSMILHEVACRLPREVRGIEVEIFIEDGERLAKKTLNPRLGVVGGLSVLGTTGIVKPFSTESYRETIDICLQGAKREGLDTVVFSTGGKSERLARTHVPELPDIAFIQIADFIGFALEKTKQVEMQRIILSCFFGKLCKWALGGEYTHANTQDMDFHRLAALAAASGISDAFCQFVKTANTARQIVESGFTETEAFIHIVGEQALQFIARKVEHTMKIVIYCWPFDGNDFFRWAT